MDNQALNDLLTTSRLYPDERQELIHLLGRVARLEVVEADCRALVDALPKDLQTFVFSTPTRKKRFEAALVRISSRASP